MANTWTAYFPGMTFAVNKNMAAVINTGATRLIKVRRIGMINYQVGAVTGALCLFELRKYTGAGLTSPTAVTPVAHDTTNSALVATTCGYGGTPSGSALKLIRQVWSSDEPAVGAATSDEWEIIPVLNYLWVAGYGDDNVQSVSLRENEMICVYNTVGATGAADFWIEFTDETV